MSKYPDSQASIDWEDLVDMTLEEKAALPVRFHRPYFDAMGSPNLWLCEVCWDEGTVTGWPCDTATDNGLELADQLGFKAIR